MDIFRSVWERIQHVFSSNNKAASKGDLLELLSNTIEMHQTIIKTYDTIKSDQFKKLYFDHIQPKLDKYPGKIEPYKNYCSKLSSSLAANETKKPMSTLIDANYSMLGLLSSIKNKVDKYFDEETIEVSNIKMSQIGIMKIISHATTLADYTRHMFTYLINTSIDLESSAPKYRVEFMIKHNETITNLVNAIVTKKGIFAFANEIAAISNRPEDVVLSRAMNPSMLARSNLAGDIARDESVGRVLGFILMILRAPADWANAYISTSYKRNKELRDFLAQYVAACHMALDSLDISSPKYMRTVEAIKVYSTKMAELDRATAEIEAKCEEL